MYFTFTQSGWFLRDVSFGQAICHSKDGETIDLTYTKISEKCLNRIFFFNENLG